MNNCRNCKEPIDANWDFCPTCGRQVKLNRINKHYIIQEFGDFLLANRGLVYTIKRMLVSPGESVRQFITEDRYRFVKPITFLFITALIYAFVNQIFKVRIEDYYPQLDVPDIVPTTTLILNWFIANPGYMNIITIVFIAFGIKIFFRKTDYNIFEIFILCCFVFGITTLFEAILTIIREITQLKLHILMSISIIYVTWAIGQFFDKKKVASYIKALLSYMFGWLIFCLIAVIGVLIEFKLSH